MRRAQNTVFVALTGQGGSVLQSRSTADSPTASIDGPQTKLPHWLKLVRKGDSFAGYVSGNGTSWTPVGSTTNALTKNLSIGLALTSHNNSILNSTLFDHVAISK